jgi:GNAT superfamily N-acetyltransferase
MEIRNLTKEDLASLVKLYIQLDENNANISLEKARNVWDEIEANKNIQYIGAVDNGKVVSTCYFTIIPNLTKGSRSICFIENVVTDKDYRKQGLGKKVIQKAIDVAKENNCYEIVNTTKGGTVVNPKGTVYLEANSATGSKFYNLITAKQDFISERSQTWTPSYSVVNVTDDSFEVTTYDADTGKVLDGSSSYKIVKKAEDTKKDDANSNTTKKDDTTAVQAKNQTITATASYKKSETSKAFKLNAKTNGNGKLTYTTSNKAVATVDAAGKVTVKGPGVAKITVKAAATTDYKAASKTVTVTVAPKKQSISLVNKIKKQLTIKWKKNTKASGYQVVYSTNKKFTGKSKNSRILSIK